VKRYGDGCIYKRKGSPFFWIKYSIAGKVHRRSSGSTKHSDAVKLLRHYLGSRHQVNDPAKAERLTLGELLEGLATHYETQGFRSLTTMQNFCRHLTDYFGPGYRALGLTSDEFDKYRRKRQGDGASNASINRECAALRAAFQLKVNARKLPSAAIPRIAKLPESEPRSGFIGVSDFHKLKAKLPEHLRDSIEFLFLSAWRVGAMRALQWTSVDWKEGTITCRAESAKNKRTWTLPMVGELRALLERQWAKRDGLYVFHHRGGQPLLNFWRSWRTATRQAGFAGLTVHDLRRSAIKHLSDSGVPMHVAMGISQHKTASVFARYRIVVTDDLARALEKRDAFMAEKSKQPAKVVALKRRA